MIDELVALLTARARHYSAQDAGEPDELVRFVREHAEELAKRMASEPSPASGLATELVRAVERRQQFAPSDAALSGKLERVFEQSWRELAAAIAQRHPEQTITPIFEREARQIRELLAAKLGAGPTVCAEYSIELQLDLLGISPATLVEPILDLGCGEHAALVGYLRAQGKVASGLDRHAAGPDAVQADWLGHGFARETFGTIVSHQAFSLHFLHHHLGSGEQAEAYARKYMELLGALKPGGSFVYTPGLPFVEQHLPARRWQVARKPLPSPLRETVDDVFSSRVGAAVAYTCRVTKL